MQLKRIGAFLITLLAVIKTFDAFAQSTTKLKRLRYQEVGEGITVDEDALEVLLELDDGDELSFLYVHDVITGASPTGIEDEDTQTGASPESSTGRGQLFEKVDDTRNTVSMGYLYQIDRLNGIQTKLGYSKENDYLSQSGSFGYIKEANSKNTTLSIRLNVANDIIAPTDRSEEYSKNSGEIFFSLNQNLDKRSFGSLGISYGNAQGYLTDPYKKVKIGDVVQFENRPETRNFFSTSVDYRRKFLENHAFRINLKLYADSWDIKSSTNFLETRHEISELVLLTLFIRHYNQTAANFWNESFDAGYGKEYYSSDFRLSQFSANTLGTTCLLRLNENWWLEVSYSNYYQYTDSFQTSSDPNLLVADVYSAAVQYRFF